MFGHFISKNQVLSLSDSNAPVANQRGQGLTEYLILVALIAVAAITVSSRLGGQITFSMAQITKKLGGDVSSIRPEKIRAGDVESRTMTNFFKDDNRHD